MSFCDVTKAIIKHGSFSRTNRDTVEVVQVAVGYLICGFHTSQLLLHGALGGSFVFKPTTTKPKVLQ